MKRIPLLVLIAVLILAVHLDRSGTHLIPVLVGMALVMGSVLLVAAAELSNAKWIARVKPALLATAPLLFVFPALLGPVPFPWLQHPTAWLTPDFFLIRNIAALLVLALVGNLFAQRSRREEPTSRRWAVAYILTFAVVKTLVAMDWVMSFDYPWISTMFPVLYMVECLYAGLALTGIICFVLETRRAGATGATLYDSATLLFGFALFWGGLFYAQYLTIWYANIPEEVSFFTNRQRLMGGSAFFYATVLLLFGIPFTALLLHKARTRPGAVMFLAHVVLIGLVVHRAYHLLPHVEFDLAWLLAQSAAMFGAVALAVRPALDAE